MAGALNAVSPQLHYPFPFQKLSYRVHLPVLIPFHQKNGELLICNSKGNGESEDLNGVSFAANGVMEDCESDEEEEEEEEEENTESSIDLLLRLLQSMFKRVSKKARKASRGVLPDVFSPQLVSFAVDGVLLLALLSVLKALLEVICTLGGTVFVAILLLRVIWSAVSYFESGTAGPCQSRTSYGRTQPMT